MVTTPAEVEAPPTRVERTNAAVRSIVGGVASFTRSALTGNPKGRIRRSVLFLVAGIGLWGAADWWVFSIAGLVAVLLLALTDTYEA